MCVICLCPCIQLEIHPYASGSDRVPQPGQGQVQVCYACVNAPGPAPYPCIETHNARHMLTYMPIGAQAHMYTHRAHTHRHTQSQATDMCTHAGTHTHTLQGIHVCLGQTGRGVPLTPTHTSGQCLIKTTVVLCLKVCPSLLGIVQFLTTSPALRGETGHIWNEE